MKQINLITKITVYSYEECTEIEKKLIDAAKQATFNAYAPYSKFHVGAALQLENGKIITGNNQENAAYPSGLCAERTAVFYANAQYPDQKIKAIAVAAYYNGDFTNDLVSPCGSCRQVLLEVESRYNSPVKILMYNKNNEVYVAESMSSLMPLSFDKKALD
ncbi:MAG: cytidine deaminase [Dysgonamonadaceae bacterium]|jgi:cytidine deaminase|nr:cytidine deaminase [Dysgonamonadaceae bacterium]MDD3356101.1 cytidine deaminase [Dysgonamonadaceae bacterium]MDD3727190.1 cytidine deaminase [Dysgonamonadaceae bacterium]MDD4246757.1 cytidine deaminase [Dysgonamonadaceae bacterium]MDD4605741.1 cytidine deaminase [Dysgonamonadaceae bacterium]